MNAEASRPQRSVSKVGSSGKTWRIRVMSPSPDPSTGKRYGKTKLVMGTQDEAMDALQKLADEFMDAQIPQDFEADDSWEDLSDEDDVEEDVVLSRYEATKPGL